MFDGLFRLQSFLNAKIFNQNYFSMGNNYDRWILIQLEVFIRACWCYYVKKNQKKKRINTSWHVQIALCHVMGFFWKINGVLWTEKKQIRDILLLWMFRENKLLWILNSFNVIFPVDGEILKKKTLLLWYCVVVVPWNMLQFFYYFCHE